MNEWEQFLDRADESFDSADLLLNGRFVAIAASRTYFGWFYVATALLAHRGAKFKKHSAVVAQFGFIFARTAILDPRFHHELLTAELLREEADYASAPEVDESHVTTLLAEGRQFLAAAGAYLASQPNP